MPTPKKTRNKRKEDEMDEVSCIKKIEEFFETILKTKDEEIKEKNEIIKKLETHIEVLSENFKLFTILSQNFENLTKEVRSLKEERIQNPKIEGEKMTYSQITAISTPVVNSYVKNIDQEAMKAKNNTVLIKPLNKTQNYKKTKEDIRKFVKPEELKIGIEKIYNLDDGGIKIQCKTEQEANLMKKKAEDTIGNYYNIKGKIVINPRIKIIGIEEELSEAELKNTLVTENHFITPEAKIGVMKIKKMKTKYMAIVECDGKTFSKIMENGAVIVKFSVCSVFEHINILRCFRCTGFGHTGKTCTKESVCIKCGSLDHEAMACKTNKENICCPNCKEANEKFKVNLFINHSPFDQNCQLLKKRLETEKLKINYNGE